MDKRLLTVLVVIVAVRIIITHHAVRSFPDEYFYNYSLFALLQLKDLDIQQFLSEIFSAGRPGYNVIALIPASFQTLLYIIFDLDPRSTASLLIPQLCNGIVNVLLLVIYYRILKLYIHSKHLAGIFVVAYALLVHNSIYTVHLFPYDYALCLLLWLLYQFLKMYKYGLVLGNRAILLYATALCWSFLIYPGYYLMIPFFFVSMWLLYRRQTIKKRIASFAVFSGVFLTNLLVFQVLSLIGNTNYFVKSQRLSRSILQGSFEEGFSFLYKYLSAVEHIPFILVLFGLGFYILREWRAVLNGNSLLANGLFLLFVYTLFMYIYNGINIYFLHNQVNYGRLLHPYYPVIFTCIFVAISGLRHTYSMIFGYLVAVSLFVNLAVFYYNVSQSAYPLSLAEEYKIDIQHSQKLYTHLSPVPYTAYSVMQDQKFTLINFAYFTELRVGDLVKTGVEDTLYWRPHFINLEPYQFEGYNLVERKTLDLHPVYTGIFRN